MRPGGLFAPISREGALVLNNLLLTAAARAVLVGTLYPLVLDALTGERISVGAPFFNLTFGPLMAPLLVAMPFGPFLAWKRGDLPSPRSGSASPAAWDCRADPGLCRPLRGGPRSPRSESGRLLGDVGALAELVEPPAAPAASNPRAGGGGCGLPRSA